VADENLHSALEHEHTPEAIRDRIAGNNQHGMLGDFVLGAVDGAVTTFAIVSGTAGAGLSAGVALVLGLANVLADGLSMAIGNYLKTRADQQMVHRYRRLEERHIDRVPEGERAEIREIFANKGFSGDTLEQIVDTITSDRKRWVEVMLVEEWGLPTQVSSPTRAGVVTFIAFVLAGFVPLLPLMFSGILTTSQTFTISAIATAVTFVIIGAIRGVVAEQPKITTIFETLVTGGIAATVSFLVGALLRQYAI
jgi:VIT1/CCC1 family predicted Fe2+/Mn2+ transporter